MAIPLSNRQRWQLAAGVAVLACAYLFLTAKEFAASAFASSPKLPQLQRAVWLSPGNADYRYRLGRYFAFVAGDPQSAISSFRAAVALNPYDARYWFDLAGAYEVTGDTSGQRTALEHALQADPTAPDVAWEAANFFLLDNDVDRALREFRVVIENDTSLADASLRASWRVRPDTESLLRDVVPPRADALIAFLHLLMGKQETDGTIKTWQRLAQLDEKFENRYLYEYVNYLIGARRPDAAMTAWEQSADTLGLSAYVPSDDNLVVNGDFSLDVLNGGFDWTYVDRAGVRPLLDPTAFHQGHRSLFLTFEGPGISDAGVSQLIPVRGGTTYDFSAYYKSAEFEGAGGPQVVLRDAYTGAPLFASNLLNDTDFWKEVHSKITTPNTTSLLVLAIERFPAGSPIRGKLWLDDFELSPADSEDSPNTPKDTP
ncbi:MAG TPA: tetratricopeptide repeat protein [Terriglobales bacterium]|nr:tetratricopeptide repeat protein [Terriglobales bacterium]